MRKVLTFAVALAGVLAIGVPAFAHHGDAAYDESKPVVLKDCQVTEYDWMNPHSLIKCGRRSFHSAPAACGSG